METEPIRRAVYPAAVVAALATLLGFLGVADRVTWQTVATAASLSLVEFAALAFGAEFARSQAWPSATVDSEVADATRAGYSAALVDLDDEVARNAEAVVIDDHSDIL
jgi:hypothetical protein